MELLVVMALLLVFLLALEAYLPLGTPFWQRNAALAEAQQHGRIAMEELSHELQYAYKVSFVRQPQRSVLTYYKRVNGVLRRYRIYLRGQQLLLDLPTGTAVPLAGYVKDFWAEPEGELSPGRFLRLGVTVGKYGQNLELEKAVYPRNVGQEW